MLSYMVGNCSLCKIEKPLPFLRDDYIICEDCNRQITDDLEKFNTVECEICFGQFSPLWVKEVLGQIRCKNCQPGGLCGGCHRDIPLPFFGVVEGMNFFMCQECKDSGKY